MDWLTSEDGIVNRLGKLANITLIIMPADSYAERNGFDMRRAQTYWQNVECELWCDTTTCVLPASIIESTTIMGTYMADESYALEKLVAGTRKKVVQAAGKYSASSPDQVYESAGEYAMYRAAEAKFVVNDLQALWVSLNWPERDAMCGDTPRIYAPEAVRAPWLKEEV